MASVMNWVPCGLYKTYGTFQRPIKSEQVRFLRGSLSLIITYMKRIKCMKFGTCITNLNNFTLIFRTRRFETVFLKKIRSSPVAVKYFESYTTSKAVENEALFLKRCQPLIYGMSNSQRPFYIVTQFYGSEDLKPVTLEVWSKKRGGHNSIRVRKLASHYNAALFIYVFIYIHYLYRNSSE